MPQASPELRAEMTRRFGGIDDRPPRVFLENRGYTLRRDYCFYKPGVTQFGQMPRDEFEALMFLIHEWDYGGLAKEPDPPRPEPVVHIDTADTPSETHVTMRRADGVIVHTFTDTPEGRAALVGKLRDMFGPVIEIYPSLGGVEIRKPTKKDDGG